MVVENKEEQYVGKAMLILENVLSIFKFIAVTNKKTMKEKMKGMAKELMS